MTVRPSSRQRPAARGSDDLIFRPIASGNVFEETVQRLTHAIKIGAVRPGERFPPERELAPRLGVSRVTLREAIRALEQAGYVQLRRGRSGGAFVTYRPRRGGSERTARRLAKAMGDDLFDALDFRRVVEPGAAELAAERVAQPAVESLQSLVADTMSAPRDEYRSADARLHLAIAELAGSPSVSRAVADLQMRLTDLLAAIPRLEPAIDHSNGQHQAIVAAISAGDPATARVAMQEHVEATATLIRGFLA